jgi:hypothetical protein
MAHQANSPIYFDVSAAFPGVDQESRRSNSPSCDPSIGAAAGHVLFPVSVLSTALSAWLSSTSVRPRNFSNPQSHDQTTSTKVLLCLVACDTVKFEVRFHSQSHEIHYPEMCLQPNTWGGAGDLRIKQPRHQAGFPRQYHHTSFAFKG